MTNKTIDNIFEEGQLYFHCAYCGDIYSGGKEGQVIYNNGIGKGLGKDLRLYEITSGVCEPCYIKEMKKLEDMKNEI